MAVGNSKGLVLHKGYRHKRSWFLMFLVVSVVYVFINDYSWTSIVSALIFYVVCRVCYNAYYFRKSAKYWRDRILKFADESSIGFGDGFIKGFAKIEGEALSLYVFSDESGILVCHDYSLFPKIHLVPWGSVATLQPFRSNSEKVDLRVEVFFKEESKGNIFIPWASEFDANVPGTVGIFPIKSGGWTF